MVGMMGWGAPAQGWRKGPWTPEEDKLLTEYVNLNGEGRWSSVARSAGLNRSGKSCRLRWVNYLRPGLKRGQITPQEEGIIIELHALWGNKWSTIARYLPGRTDNEIKNYWRTHFKKKEKSPLKQEKQKSQILKQKQQQQQLLQNNQIKDQQQQQFMYPTMEDQCMPVMYQDVEPWPNSAEEEELWGSLWNLDDTHGCVDHTGHCDKMAMQNQAPTFSYGGVSKNFHNGGYIS